MDIEATRKYCLDKKGVTEDIKWESHLCFSVGEKIFLITSPDDIPCNATFKVKDEDYDAFIEQDGFVPAPHLARYKWVMADDIESIPDQKWKEYLDTSYEIILSKLSKKKIKEILDE